MKERWVDELPEVFWAYRTTNKMSTRETPFSLDYEYEAMIPVEIGMSLLKRETYDRDDNYILQRHELDLLKEKRVPQDYE